MLRKRMLLFVAVFFSVCIRVPGANLAYKPGELIVRFAPGPTGQQLTVVERNAVLTRIGGGYLRHSYKLVPGLNVVKLPENMSVESALEVFQSVGDILYAEPNYRIKLLSTFPNDPRFNEQWGLHNTGQGGGTVDADIDAPEAWDIHTGSSSVIVAVLDGGIDRSHPDLSANMWVNTGEIPNNGIDDDGNGYVDDIYGYDFYWDPVTHPRDPDPMDEYGHGTKMAGIVGAVGNNSEGVVGVCWNVRIMAAKFEAPYGGAACPTACWLFNMQ